MPSGWGDVCSLLLDNCTVVLQNGAIVTQHAYSAESATFSEAAVDALVRFRDMLMEENPGVISIRPFMCWHIFTDASHEPVGWSTETDQRESTEDHHLWVRVLRFALCFGVVEGFVIPLQCSDTHWQWRCEKIAPSHSTQPVKTLCQFLMLVWGLGKPRWMQFVDHESSNWVKHCRWPFEIWNTTTCAVRLCARPHRLYDHLEVHCADWSHLKGGGNRPANQPQWTKQCVAMQRSSVQDLRKQTNGKRPQSCSDVMNVTTWINWAFGLKVWMSNLGNFRQWSPNMAHGCQCMCNNFLSFWISRPTLSHPEEHQRLGYKT